MGVVGVDTQVSVDEGVVQLELEVTHLNIFVIYNLCSHYLIPFKLI